MKPLIILALLIGIIPANAQIQSSTDSTFKWLTIEREGYSIQYPSIWTIDTVNTRAYAADLAILSQRASGSDRFSENINVMVQDLKALSINLDQFVEISEQQIKTMITNSNIISSIRVTKNNIVFHKILFTGTQGQFDLKTEQYYYILGEKAFVITLSAENREFENYKDVGERILNSFKFKK